MSRGNLLERMRFASLSRPSSFQRGPLGGYHRRDCEQETEMPAVVEKLLRTKSLDENPHLNSSAGRCVFHLAASPRQTETKTTGTPTSRR